MKKLVRSEKGFTLIEVLVALALVGLIAVAFLVGISTASKAVLVADQQTTARSLASSQMEYVKGELYDNDGFYEAAIPQEYVDAGYSAMIDAVEIDDGIQKITVTVSRYGNPNPILTLEDYKVNR